MDIRQQKKKNKLNVSVIGRLDTTTAPDLEKAIQLDDIDEVVFDLSETDYISSAGLRVLLTFLKIMDVNHGKMSIRNLKPDVRAVFEEVGFDTIMNLD